MICVGETKIDGSNRLTSDSDPDQVRSRLVKRALSSDDRPASNAAADVVKVVPPPIGPSSELTHAGRPYELTLMVSTVLVGC